MGTINGRCFTQIYIYQMLALRRLHPSFRFSWWGEARIIKQSLLPKQSRDRDYKHQLEVLYTKASNARSILGTFSQGKVIHHWPQESQEVKVSQKGQDTGTHAPQTISTQQLILNSLEENKSGGNQDEKQALDELIAMLTPSETYSLNRTAYSQQRIQKEGPNYDSYSFSPNPVLLCMLLDLIKIDRHKIFIGSFGIGKTTALMLLTELFNTVCLYEWLKYDKNGQASSNDRVPPTYKLIYITIDYRDSEKAILNKLKDQLREVDVSSIKSWEQLIDNLPVINQEYTDRKIQLCLIIDQINTYYSTVRSLREIVDSYVVQQQMKKPILTNKGVMRSAKNVSGSIQDDLKQKQMRRQLSSNTRSLQIMKFLRQQKFQKYIQSLDIKLQPLRKDESQRGQILKSLFAKYTNILCNSSRTIETYLFKFCEKNGFFDITKHTDPLEFTFPYQRIMLTEEGQFVMNQKLIFEIKRLLSRYELTLEQDQQNTIMKQLTQKQWPTWTKHLTLAKVMNKQFSKNIEQLLRAKRQVSTDHERKNSVQEQHVDDLVQLIKAIRIKVNSVCSQGILDRFKTFIQKGASEEQFYKLYLFLSVFQKIKDRVEEELPGQTQDQRQNYQVQNGYFQVSFEELNLIYPSSIRFLLRQLKDKNEKEIRQEKQVEIMRQYFELLGQFQLFEMQEKIVNSNLVKILNVYCNYKNLVKFYDLIKAQNFVAIILDKNLNPGTLGDLFEYVVEPILKNQSCSFEMPTSRYGIDENQQFILSSSREIVNFKHITAPEDPQKPKRGENITEEKFQEKMAQYTQTVTNLSVFNTIWPVFERAIQKPGTQILGLPTKPSQMEEIESSISKANMGFDIITIVYWPEKDLVQVTPIDWTLSLNLASGKMICLKGVKGEKMEIWWQKRQEDIKKMISKQIKADVVLNHVVACFDSCFNYQSRKIMTSPHKLTLNPVVANLDKIKFTKVDRQDELCLKKIMSSLKIQAQEKQDKKAKKEQQKQQDRGMDAAGSKE